MGNIRLYGSTSGYTELAPPAVAPDGVLSLPSGVGTLLTAEGGKVLQIVRATDTTNRSTTSTSFVDASISVTITPQKSTSGIIIIHVAGFRESSGLNGGNTGNVQITDSSNNPLSGAEEHPIGISDFLGEGTRSVFATFNIWAYVTPGVTSALTYKARFKANASRTIELNRSSTGQMYAIEVSA